MTNLNNLVITKINEVRDGIFKEVMEKIENIKSITKNFKHTDLKLHNVSMYLYKAVESGLITDEQSNSLFSHICELEYDSFTDWEDENISYVERSYIGRTSSFYYNVKSYCGDVIGEGVAEELLEGKDVSIINFLGDLQEDLYDYLLDNQDNQLEHTRFIEQFVIDNYANYDDSMTENYFEENLDDYLDSEIETLELLSNDLDDLLEIVNEAKLAYEYLADYKTKENEYAVAEYHLQHELEEYLAEDKAEEVFDEMLENIVTLNKIEKVEFTINEDRDNNKYLISVITNNSTIDLDTDIPVDNELSKQYVQLIVECLKRITDKKFDLK